VSIRPTDVTLYMVLVNYFTVVYLALGTWVVVSVPRTGLQTLAVTLTWIYVIPPVLCRIVLSLRGRPSGVVTPMSAAYRTWWLLTQFQMIFNRFGLLEELLRVVPGLYAAWLNLWGSRVNAMAYWSPGVKLTDRWLMHVGAGALLGGGCRIGGHVVSKTEAGAFQLILAPVTIDEGAVIGADASIGPGCRVHAHETFPAGRTMAPFTDWQAGRKRPSEARPEAAP
jgi:hypothetical protein